MINKVEKYSLDWHLKFDIKMRVPCHCNNLGQFARQSSSFVEIVNGKDFQSRRSNHDLGFVDIGSRLYYKCKVSKTLLERNNSMTITSPKLDGNMSLLGNLHNLRQFHRQSGSLVQVIDRQDLHTR